MDFKAKYLYQTHLRKTPLNADPRGSPIVTKMLLIATFIVRFSSVVVSITWLYTPNKITVQLPKTSGKTFSTANATSAFVYRKATHRIRPRFFNSSPAMGNNIRGFLLEFRSLHKPHRSTVINGNITWTSLPTELISVTYFCTFTSALQGDQIPVSTEFHPPCHTYSRI